MQCLAKFPEGMEMAEERLEILTITCTHYYQNMNEQMRKGK